MNEDTRTVYDIPAANYPKFLEQIEKLSRRSVKLIGQEIKPAVFGYELRNIGTEEHPNEIKVWNILLTCDEPKIEGWTFVARLDHSQETGNIVRCVPNTGELPAHYQTCAPACDHCRQTRYRRDTFVVRNDETGEYKQVGSSCLIDFFGHDPYKIAKLAEILGYADEVARGARQICEPGEFQLNDYRWIEVEEFVACAAQSCFDNGWVSGKAAYENPELCATREDAFIIYSGRSNVTVTAEARALAQEALEWARGLADKAELSNYENNIRVIASSVVMEGRAKGLAASIAGVYYENKRRQSVKVTDIGNFEGVIALMQRGGTKLKWPKIRLALPNGAPVVLSVAGARSKYAGSVNVTDGGSFDAGTWYGRVEPTGTWSPSRQVRPETMVSLTALLTALAHDPAKTASEYGRLTGNCCFCHLPLKDARSVSVGYGKTCASNFGLHYPTMKEAQAA